MVLHYGFHRGHPQWGVNEKIPTGYSRIYFAKGGKGFYRDNNSAFPFQEDHVYLLPNASAYNLSQDKNDPFSCLYFHFDYFPGHFKEPAILNLSDHPILNNIRAAMEISILSKNQGVFFSLTDVFTVYCREEGITRFNSGSLQPILEYIGDNISANLSLSLLSEKAGYNEQYFIRLFKKEMAMTPHQFVIAYRIKEARKLLLQGSTITEIAQKTGFSDIKTFSRCFKKRTGLSPTEFKKNPLTGP